MILKQSAEEGAIMQDIRGIHHISAMVGDWKRYWPFIEKFLDYGWSKNSQF